MRTRTIIATVAILAGGLAACLSGNSDDTDSSTDGKKSSSPKSSDPSKLDDAASLACDDFARGYKGAQTQQARIDLADKVNKWAQQSSTTGIAENATVLARGSEASAGAWQIGADAFAQSCLDAGWDA
ncbi:hypothetical protein ACWD4Z_19290 [Streptomyces antibioticus]